ncbi:MAG TPA: response regulator, partial [Verrucomicrobiae bacterium]|nr:response regulator [Verrucomicrobiae bacterium]
VLTLGLSPTEITQAHVGLRPGEKMHEALWEDSEEMLASDHARIFVLRQHAKPLSEVEALIGEMEDLAMSGNFTRLLRKIQEAVPSYSPPDKAPLSVVPEVSEQYRVLVIDDNEQMCDVLAKALTLNGMFKVTIAHTAREGFDRIKAEVPHLILLDVKLPDKSGLEICQILRSHPAFNQIPIIMMTGYTQEADVVTGLQAGADDYLCKPFRIEELLARVEAMLRRGAGLPTAGSVV